MMLFIWNFQKWQIYKDQWLPKAGGGWEESGERSHWVEVSLEGDECVLKLDYGDGCTTL